MNHSNIRMVFFIVLLAYVKYNYYLCTINNNIMGKARDFIDNTIETSRATKDYLMMKLGEEISKWEDEVKVLEGVKMFKHTPEQQERYNFLVEAILYGKMKLASYNWEQAKRGFDSKRTLTFTMLSGKVLKNEIIDNIIWN